MSERNYKRVDLDEQLLRLRGYGVTDLVLSGRALPPWMRSWAAEHGVEFRNEPDAPLGVAYLGSRHVESTTKMTVLDGYLGDKLVDAEGHEVRVTYRAEDAP